MPAFSLHSRYQTAQPRTVVTTSSCSLLLIYQPRKNERLSWPGWLTYRGRFTHISGHPSAAGPAKDSESCRSKTTFYRCTTQPTIYAVLSQLLIKETRRGSFFTLTTLYDQLLRDYYELNRIQKFNKTCSLFKERDTG